MPGTGTVGAPAPRGRRSRNGGSEEDPQALRTETIEGKPKEKVAMTDERGSNASEQSTDQPASDVRHETFTVTRGFEEDRSRVFASFADERIRRRWFRIPGSGAAYEHDFRVGGGEDAVSTFVVPGGPSEELRNRSRYLDIVVDRRIVFVYEAIVNGVTRWASLATVTFEDAANGGCTLFWTEQVAFLARTGDGSADLPHLRTGTALRLNGIPAALGSGDR
jgi:uncharacterized protein YndB with AHSA1/START domain